MKRDEPYRKIRVQADFGFFLLLSLALLFDRSGLACLLYTSDAADE